MNLEIQVTGGLVVPAYNQGGAVYTSRCRTADDFGFSKAFPLVDDSRMIENQGCSTAGRWLCTHVKALLPLITHAERMLTLKIKKACCITRMNRLLKWPGWHQFSHPARICTVRNGNQKEPGQQQA